MRRNLSAQALNLLHILLRLFQTLATLGNLELVNLQTQRLLKYLPPFAWVSVKHTVSLTLRDYVVARWTKRHSTQKHLRTIYRICITSITLYLPLKCHLVELDAREWPGTRSERSRGIIKHKRHARPILPWGRVRTTKYQILTTLAAQTLHRLFAQHPTQTLGHIRLTRTIRPHNSRDGRIKVKSSLLPKTLKPIYL